MSKTDDHKTLGRLKAASNQATAGHRTHCYLALGDLGWAIDKIESTATAPDHLGSRIETLFELINQLQNRVGVAELKANKIIAAITAMVDEFKE